MVQNDENKLAKLLKNSQILEEINKYLESDESIKDFPNFKYKLDSVTESFTKNVLKNSKAENIFVDKVLKNPELQIKILGKLSTIELEKLIEKSKEKTEDPNSKVSEPQVAGTSKSYYNTP
ncbi:hypothetical protein [Wolbachia endosymbiont of Pentidionis agamae]|uniref:hypothetical protein n=1 Tax=Wolbachia endosymbiont of Pentidionis agamae TaxID=3110435 RepID=UPI002FD21DF1